MTLLILGFALLLVIIVVGYFIISYNKLVRTKENIGNSRGQIATQIESRWDALTSLIEATKKYSLYEAETIEGVINQRRTVDKNMDADDYQKVQDEFQGSLSRIVAISESYPELKASVVYKKSMESINEYENNVRLSRMSYNDTVTKYNRLIVMIPTNIIASITGHSKEDYFESNEDKKEMPMW